MRIAFWNIRQKPALVAALARHADPDVIIVAECGSPGAALGQLRAIDTKWSEVVGTGPLVAVFDRASRVTAVDSMERGAVLKLARPGGAELLLFAVHLWSQTRIDVEKVSLRVGRLKQVILQHEAAEQHRRSIVIGDFNLDPWSLGLSDRELLMAVSDLRQARRAAAKRAAAASVEAVFYNPMWSRLGDRSAGPPGTYHRSSDSHRDYFFHMFDQVLLRPGIADTLDAVDVPRTLGPMRLVTGNDIPRTSAASDHLPLLVDLK